MAHGACVEPEGSTCWRAQCFRSLPVAQCSLLPQTFVEAYNKKHADNTLTLEDTHVATSAYVWCGLTVRVCARARRGVTTCAAQR